MGRTASKISGGKVFAGAPFDEVNDKWDEFQESFGPPVSTSDAVDLLGYVATGKSFALNRKFYDGQTDKLTDQEKKTVAALDKVISTHRTPKDGVYTRYVGENAIQNTLGLSNAQMGLLKGIKFMDSEQVVELNKALRGTKSESPSYNSTSAISKHLFSGKPFRREISVPKGTRAFAADNPGEHEVIFGRNMRTRLDHVSWDGKHIVIHEIFDGYY